MVNQNVQSAPDEGKWLLLLRPAAMNPWKGEASPEVARRIRQAAADVRRYLPASSFVVLADMRSNSAEIACTASALATELGLGGAGGCDLREFEKQDSPGDSQFLLLVAEQWRRLYGRRRPVVVTTNPVLVRLFALAHLDPQPRGPVEPEYYSLALAEVHGFQVKPGGVVKYLPLA